MIIDYIIYIYIYINIYIYTISIGYCHISAEDWVLCQFLLVLWHNRRKLAVKLPTIWTVEKQR